LGVSMGALLEGVPTSAAEVAAGLAALRAVRVPAAFLAYLEACGAALRAEAPEPDAEPADDDDADAVAARAAGRDVYRGCQHDAGALWSVVDDECAFAVLQAALLAASAYAWDLSSLPIDDVVEQLCTRFPRFLTRNVICTVFGPPPPSAARASVSGGAGAGAAARAPASTSASAGSAAAGATAALSFAAVARAVGVRTLLRMQMAASPAGPLATGAGVAAAGGASASSAAGAGLQRQPSSAGASSSAAPGAGGAGVGLKRSASALSSASSDAYSASSSAAVAEAEVPLLTRFLGTTQAAALTVLAPPAVVAALLRHDAVKVEPFLREWAAAMPAEMLADTQPTAAAASAPGEGCAAEDASSGSLSLDLLTGLTLTTAPSAGPGGSGSGAASSSSASAAVGASVGFAASVAPTIRYFPQDLLAHDPGPRFKQLFSVRPKWTMEELAPFIAPLAGSKGGGGAPAVPGKTMDELLLAFTRVTYLPAGGKLFSAR